MTKLMRNSSSDQTKPHEGPQNYTVLKCPPKAKCSGNPIKLSGILFCCLMGFFVLFSVFKNPSSSSDSFWLLDFNPFRKDAASGNTTKPQPTEVPQDKLLGGLLLAGLDEKSCLSRYQSILYRKRRTGHPSSHLISRLRSYEALHKRCGPYTESYNRTMDNYLKTGQVSNSTGCNYLVWISYSGLGNKILTLASAFLYALLTNRVLLVDPGGHIPDLFCEPFPEVSWLLPSDFPIPDKLFNSFDQKSPESYGNLVKNNNLTLPTLPSFVYLHLLHDYDKNDMLFFCDEHQIVLQEVPWLIMKSNNYFIPSLFLIPSFVQELNDLFPEKGAVFHYLGRYLFHPTNSVWGLITRYYITYLAKADEKIGIQIRVLETDSSLLIKHVLDQILACVWKENLLPKIEEQEPENIPSGKPIKRTKAVLITSLSSGYFEAIRDMYWEHPTITGDVIRIYQPSQEEYQHTEKQIHNMKAWAEIYLLSLTDKLVTSGWSTFGYVAQSLGGLKPWILYKPENQTAPNPPCQRAVSMEPCFHAPPTYDCRGNRGIDIDELLVPHVQHCEDRSWGLKLVDRDDGVVIIPVIICVQYNNTRFPLEHGSKSRPSSYLERVYPILYWYVVPLRMWIKIVLYKIFFC